MQRVYAIFSAVLLAAFISMIALQLDSQIVESESFSIEEADLEDFEDKEKEEIQFHLKDLNRLTEKTTISTMNRMILVDYLFSIKSSSQKVSSPPPEA